MGIEVWRGGVNPWQCDQMGHLNVRFYVAHAVEALAGLAAALGMTRAYSPHATSTLVVREHHIRFLKEARVGDPLHMTVGVLDFGDTGATIFQALHHSLTGEVSAVVQTRLEHVSGKDAQPFAWPRSARSRAEVLMLAVPKGLEPRSLSPGDSPEDASIVRADALGLHRYGAGAFGVPDCDAFGRVGPGQLAARIGDGATQSIAAIRQACGQPAGPPAEGASPVGMAVVEYRLVYRRSPTAGDRFDTRTGLRAVEARRLRQTHWMLDPETGHPWAEVHAVLVPFDLDKRKAMSLPPQALETLSAQVARFEG